MSEPLRLQNPTSPQSEEQDLSRTGKEPTNVHRGFLDHIRYSRGKNPETATPPWAIIDSAHGENSNENSE